MFVFSRFLIIAFVTTLLFGCSKTPVEPIKILANPWVGYTHLFYAKEKGWLKELNIELTLVVSLGESLMAFET
jgi:NitT/TauT family transport system substrate-binding protein